MNNSAKALLILISASSIVSPVFASAGAGAGARPKTPVPTPTFYYANPVTNAQAAYNKVYNADINKSFSVKDAIIAANLAYASTKLATIAYDNSHNLTTANLVSTVTNIPVPVVTPPVVTPPVVTPPLPSFYYSDPSAAAASAYNVTYNKDLANKKSVTVAKQDATAAAALASSNAQSYNTSHSLTTKNLVSNTTVALFGNPNLLYVMVYTDVTNKIVGYVYYDINKNHYYGIGYDTYNNENATSYYNSFITSASIPSGLPAFGTIYNSTNFLSFNYIYLTTPTNFALYLDLTKK